MEERVATYPRFTIDFVLSEYIRDMEKIDIGMFYCTYYNFECFEENTFHSIFHAR